MALVTKLLLTFYFSGKKVPFDAMPIDRWTNFYSKIWAPHTFHLEPHLQLMTNWEWNFHVLTEQINFKTDWPNLKKSEAIFNNFYPWTFDEQIELLNKFRRARAVSYRH